MEPMILASASPRRQDFFRLMGLPFTCVPAMIDETPLPGLTPQQAAEELARRKALAVADRLHSSTTTPHRPKASASDCDIHVASRCADLVNEHSLTLCPLERPTPHSPLPPEERTRTGERVDEQMLHGVGQEKAVVTKKSAGPPTPYSSPWVFGADTIVVLEGEIFGKPAGRDDARRMLERLAGRRHEVITAMALYNGQRKTVDCRSKISEVAFAPLTGAEIEWYLDTGEWEGAAGAYRLQEMGACLIESINGSPSGVAGLPLYELYVMLRDNGYPYGAW
jgi:MAF protein